MKFFKKYFKENWIEHNTGELGVLCPFPHTDGQGNQYYESVPSAHINERKSVFHCKVCGAGMNEAAFLSKLQGISYKDALILLKEMETKGEVKWEQEHQNFLNSPGALEEWTSLGLTKETAELLQIGYRGEGLDFPVFIYGDLLDTRNYKPGRTPKVKSETGTKNL
jgi:DNA primase